MDDLRAVALDALGPAGDALARRALEHGRVSLEAAGPGWESSHGHVAATGITLWVDAETLGRLDESPFSRDALERAFGVAMARRPLESMTQLSVRWGRASAETASYRDAPAREAEPSDTAEIVRALRAYLDARGRREEAALVARAIVSRDPDGVALRLPRGEARGPTVEIVSAALARLLAPTSSRVVRDVPRVT
jgi:hypothetical protein